MRKQFVFTLLLVLLSSGLAMGQVYKWMDKKGEVHFTTTPPPKEANDVQVRDRETEESKSAPAVSAQPEIARPSPPMSSPAAASQPKIAGPAPATGIFLNKLYTSEKIESEKARLEKAIKYNRTDCSAAQQRVTKGRPPEFWDRYCEDNAVRSERSLDVLTTDPDRYFYVIDWVNKKATGETVDNPPFYRHWN